MGKSLLDYDHEYLTNCTWGGEGISGMHHSDKTTRKMSEKKKGKKGIQAGKNHPLYGKHHSAESKLKMSESHKGIQAGEKNGMWGKPSPNRSKVICITTGKTFNSQTDAGDWYNVARSNISKCCKGKLKHAGKLNGVPLQWKYLDDYDN